MNEDARKRVVDRTVAADGGEGKGNTKRERVCLGTESQISVKECLQCETVPYICFYPYCTNKETKNKIQVL